MKNILIIICLTASFTAVAQTAVTQESVVQEREAAIVINAASVREQAKKSKELSDKIDALMAAIKNVTNIESAVAMITNKLDEKHFEHFLTNSVDGKPSFSQSTSDKIAKNTGFSITAVQIEGFLLAVFGVLHVIARALMAKYFPQGIPKELATWWHRAAASVSNQPLPSIMEQDKVIQGMVAAAVENALKAKEQK